MKLVFLLLGLLLAQSAHSTDSPLLLVVGDVSNTQARVLVEWVAPGAPRSLDVWLFPEFLLPSATALPTAPPATSFLPNHTPQIVILDGLRADQNYTAVFGSEELGVVDLATFSTHVLTPERILAFSCDRFLEDGDDEFVAEMAAAEHRRYSLAIHMGDQIYADQLVATHGKSSFEDALAAFRSLYRRAWTRPAMAAILRHGAHWMVPDDHDILNALTPHSVPDPTSGFVLAGRRAVYEYQLQLVRDIPSDPTAYTPLHQFHIRGHVAFALLDLRFHRAFFEESTHPLLGQKQHDELAAHLQLWKENPDISEILVISCVPMLFPHPFLAKVADWFENERYSTHVSLADDTRNLLALVSGAAARKPVTAIAGDLHMFCNETVCSDNNGACFSAYVSSGITRRSSALRAPHLFLYDVFAYFVLLSHLPAFGEHVAWSTTIHSVKLINNYLVLDTNNTLGPDASTPRVRVSTVLRALVPFDRFLIVLFEWAVFPLASIAIWLLILMTRAVSIFIRSKLSQRKRKAATAAAGQKPKSN